MVKQCDGSRIFFEEDQKFRKIKNMQPLMRTSNFMFKSSKSLHNIDKKKLRLYHVIFYWGVSDELFRSISMDK